MIILHAPFPALTSSSSLFSLLHLYSGQLDDELSVLLRYQRPERVSLPATLNDRYSDSGRKVPPNLGKTGRSISLMTVTYAPLCYLHTFFKHDLLAILGFFLLLNSQFDCFVIEFQQEA
jgi:hypothetical protein